MGYALKKDIVSPNSRAREVARWETYMDIVHVVRKTRVQRAAPPTSDFTQDDQELIEKLEEKIEELTNKPPAAFKAAREKREETIEEFQAQLDDLYIKRAGLTAWEDQQIYRCIHGHRTMTGFHYFLYNFGYYEHIKDGRKYTIRPDYRAADDWVSRLILQTQKKRAGIIAAKRRRFGWSWIMVAWVIYHILFDDGNVFFVTKDDGDREKFFERINFFYDRLPPFLKKPRDRDAVRIKTWLPSERIAKIRNIPIEDIPKATLRTGSPKNKESVEGDTVSCFIIDEAGKIDNLMQVIMLGLPMLAGKDGITQEGMLILGGTAGEMSGSGAQLQRLFKKPDAFDLTPVAVLAWMGAKMDEYGNDMPEATMEWARKKRKFLEEAGEIKLLTDFKQQYPFDIDEIFSIDDSNKTWPVKKITEARDLYEEQWSKKIKYGRFTRELSGVIRFVPEKARPSINADFEHHIGHNQVLILEDPDVALMGEEHAYVMGVDPVSQNKDKYKELAGSVKTKYLNSDFAFVVHKRLGSVGSKSNHPVCMYAGRHGDLDICFEQAVLAAEYYGCQMNIESNMGGRMHSYVLQHNPDLIAYGTSAVSDMRNNRAVTWGTTTNEGWWIRMSEIGENWWAKNYLLPNFLRLIDESMDIHERNTDVLVAWLLALQFAEEVNTRDNFKKLSAEAKREKIAIWQQRNGRFVPTAILDGGSEQESKKVRLNSRADKIYNTLMG